MTRTITVRGRGFAPARPTEVVVSFESAGVAPTAAEAFAEAGKRHAALDALCGELGVDEARRTTTGTSVHEFREQMEDPLSWRASFATVVHVQDAELAGRLVREAVETVEARITGGPWWRVGADDPARLEACRLAAADAERRAAAYAEALGLRRGNVVRAVEAGASDLGRREPGPVSLSFSAVDAEPELRPGTAEVAAAVDVAFELEERA
jgi:uncharacterized protein YggE